MPAYARTVRQKWNRRYAQLQLYNRQKPTVFVTNCLAQLPSVGHALDIAAGAGRHTLALAAHGLDVDAVDISWQGLKLAQQQVKTAGAIDQVQFIVADVERVWLPHRTYDVISVTYFLCRELFPLIKNRLRPGGWLLYETFTTAQLCKPYHRGSKRERFYLQPNELVEAFSDFSIVFYDEGDHQNKATSQLLARKPVINQ